MKITSTTNPYDTLYTIQNERGTSMTLSTFGACIRSFCLNGNEITMGFADSWQWFRNAPFFGLTVGRYANRIAKASFVLDGKTITLNANSNGNHLHGGWNGLHSQLWTCQELVCTIESPEKQRAAGLRFALLSPDGDEFFPGNLSAWVTILLLEDNSLLIAYEAICDKKSPINFTNHCYWNLDGEAKAKIDDLQVQINSDVWLSSVNGIPDGLIQRCESSDFDFRTPKNLKKIVENDGVDHTFILRPNQSTKCITFGSECTRFDSCTLAHKPAELNHAATIGGSLARMEVWTDKPGLQFYTGNYMPNARGRSIHLGAFQGVCAETQFFPDAPNQGSQYRLIGASLGYNVEQTKHWDSIFDSGELYRYHTLHRFT